MSASSNASATPAVLHAVARGLGKTRDSADVAAAVAALGLALADQDAAPASAAATTRVCGDEIHIEFKRAGVSLAFAVKEEDGPCLLHAVWCHGATADDGFAACGNDTLLADRTARAVVEAYGEPQRKGGGGKSGVSIWIEYAPLPQAVAAGSAATVAVATEPPLCCTFDFNSPSWEDPEAPIKRVCYYLQDPAQQLPSPS